MRLLLIRHGQTELNRQRVFQGRLDVPLDDTGHAQARALQPALSVHRGPVYSSPLLRARQTAAGAGLRATPLADLAELDVGDLDGLPMRDALARYPDFFARWAQDPAGLAVPGGESLDACQQRVVDAVHALNARHAGETVALVAHQMVFATLRCAALGQPLSAWRTQTVRNASVSLLQWSPATALVQSDWVPGEDEDLGLL